MAISCLSSLQLIFTIFLIISHHRLKRHIGTRKSDATDTSTVLLLEFDIWLLYKILQDKPPAVFIILFLFTKNNLDMLKFKEDSISP